MTDTYRPTAEAQQAEIDRLREALHEVAEELAGADGLLPPTPMGAYAVILCQRMARIASEAIGKPTNGNTQQ